MDKEERIENLISLRQTLDEIIEETTVRYIEQDVVSVERLIEVLNFQIREYTRQM